MVKTIEYRDPNRLDLIKELGVIGRKEESGLWVTVARELSRTRSSRREVNLYKINKHTTQGDVVVVPGKVLGGGRLEHKVDVAAYKFTEDALQKIRDCGGQTMHITELARKNPKGSKVKLIG